MKRELRNIVYRVRYKDIMLSQYLITCLNILTDMKSNGSSITEFVEESLSALSGLKPQSHKIYMTELLRIMNKIK